ncbi:MAG: hypothetical protein QXO76_05775 [Thermoproteota archaeon]
MLKVWVKGGESLRRVPILDGIQEPFGRPAETPCLAYLGTNI